MGKYIMRLHRIILFKKINGVQEVGLEPKLIFKIKSGVEVSVCSKLFSLIRK